MITELAPVAGNTTRRSTHAHFALNAFHGCHPRTVEHPLYHAGLDYMGVRHLRLHSWNMLRDAREHPGGWLDHAGRGWDRETVARCCEAWTPFVAGGGELVINIPGWPSWLQQRGGLLDPAHWDATAGCFAELVALVQDRCGLEVAWWEATNELDQAMLVARGEDPRGDELAEIWRRCARAMRAAGAQAVGGPAFARPDRLDHVIDFVDAVGDELAVLSVHAYGCGPADTPDQDLLARPATIGAELQAIRHALDARGHGELPLHLNEYNVAWDWRSCDPRMGDHRGAVFDACIACAGIGGGLEALMAWNECDGVYGKMDHAFRIRAPAHWFHLANRLLVGRWRPLPRLETITGAAVSAEHHEALLLVNHGPAARSVAVAVEPGPGAELWRIDEAGFRRLDPAERAGWNLLPRMSITLAAW